MNAPAAVSKLTQRAPRSRECPPHLPFVFGVGITGHRREALPAEALPAIEQRLREVLAMLASEAAAVHEREREFFSAAPPRLLFVSALADGADQMGASIALELGFELHAVLPFDRERYRADLADDEARERLDALLGRASCVLELPGETGHNLDSYVMAGRATVAHSDVLIAVWDGLPPRGRGGTGEVVRAAFDRATPTVHIPIRADEPVCLRWAAFEPAVVTQHEDASTLRAFDAHESRAVMTALLAPPPDPAERAFVHGFQNECRRRVRARVEYPLLLAVAGVSGFKRHHWRADVAAAQTKEEWSGYCAACDRAQAVSAPLEGLQLWYEWADTLAGHFAQSYRSGHVFNFILAALAVILALLALVAPAAKPVLAVSEFAAVLAILINTRFGTSQQWHRRWLDYRQLAERLRPMRSLKLLGVASPDPPGTAANPVAGRWIDWYAATVWRAIGCPSGLIDRDRLGALTDTILSHELQPQVAYHRKTAHQAELLDHRLELLGYGLFAATLVSIVVLVIGLAVDKHWVSDNVGWFTLISAGLPAVGTAVFGIRVQGDYVGSAARSEHSAQVLERIAERLGRTPDLSIAGDLVEQAARTMLADLDEWRLLNQQHDLSVG